MPSMRGLAGMFAVPTPRMLFVALNSPSRLALTAHAIVHSLLLRTGVLWPLAVNG